MAKKEETPEPAEKPEGETPADEVSAEKPESETPAEQEASAEQPKAVQEGPGSKEVNTDARLWAMICHLSALAGLVVSFLLALMAHGVGPGDQVICPSYTFFSTAGSISRLGAAPVFADIDPHTFNVNGRTLRTAAERCTRLKAILPVHLYGQAAPMGEILALGKELGVPIIEDAAQAIGARDTDGRRVGSRSNAGCFSFYPSKNLGGYGDGGMVTTGGHPQ